MERIENIIYVIRGQRIMLDRDLASLYGVQTKKLVQAVKRNIERFPDDFMFQLTWEEADSSRSQFVTLNEKQLLKRGGNIKYLPYAFTEQGVAMLSSVLRSPQAIAVNVGIMRAFIRLRQALASNRETTKEVAELKSFVLRHSQKTDQEFRKVWRAIEKLSEPAKPERRIGFDLG